MSSPAADHHEHHEHLEDGTSPSTPSEDNLLLGFARAEAAAYGALVAANRGRMLDDDEAGLHLRDLGSPSPFGNVAMLSRPLDDATIPTIARIEEFFRAGDGGPYLVFSPWRTGDWTEHGFSRFGHPPLMVRAPGGDVPLVPGIDVREVSDARSLADFERTLVEAYPVPELQPWEAGRYLHPSVIATPWRLFVAYDGPRPVATAGAFVTPEVTLVEFVSTRPEIRGRGIGAALTAAAGAVERDHPSMLISSDDGQGVYERLGYLRLLRYTIWLGHR
jgi:hypothetical protein